MNSAEDSARGPTTFELFLQATSSTKQGYNLLAPRFDATPYATPSNFISRALRRAQLRFPSNEDSTGLRAADLACGTGRATQMLASSFARVDAYDFSVGMLDRARELTQAQPNTSGRCDFIEADLPTSVCHLKPTSALSPLAPGDTFCRGGVNTWLFRS